MKIIIIAIGKCKKNSPEAALIAEYVKRSSWNIVIKEKDNASQEDEAKFLQESIPQGSKVIVLDERGENLKSAGKTGIKVRNLYDEFHTYGVEWTESYYKFYVDGVLTWTVSDKEYETKKGETVKENCISQAAEYLILSNEVVQPYVEGKTAGWCGDPMKNDLNKKYEFVIDYVRVYAQK